MTDELETDNRLGCEVPQRDDGGPMDATISMR